MPPQTDYRIAGSGLLQHKVVAVTGASQGIGKAIALACAAHGANIILHHLPSDRSTVDAIAIQEEISRMSGGQTTILVPGDISKATTAASIIKAAVDNFGRLDVLISNAGICPFHSFLDMPDRLWREVQDVNLNGAFYAVQAAANQMAAQSPQGGSIIAISSISALVGGEFQTHYTPTKAGLKSLMESCAVALGPKNIRCNSILPGTIATDINKDDLSQPGKMDYMIQRSPLRRVGVPEDVAGPAVFLASDLAKFVTGASLLVDGGAFVNFQ